MQAVEKTGQQAVEIKQDVQDQFNERTQQSLQGTVWQTGGCSSWYQTATGKNFSIWPSYSWKYWLETRKVNVADYQFIGTVSASKRDAA